jgi:hypothetical protein
VFVRIVAPDVNDVLDAPAALSPQPVTGCLANKGRWGSWKEVILAGSY